jgi:hypothetical protein
MHRRLVAAAAVLAVSVSAQERRTTGSLERPFAASGLVKMDLSAADYHITGAPRDRVRVDWSVRDSEALDQVKTRVDIRDREMRIATDGPSSKGLRFTIEVPSRSDLYVRLSAGDLTIEGISGNKDVELRAGDLRIDVGRADDYQKVDAGLWAGDIKASAFQVFKGGLFRSFDWAGKGPYRLHAHLLAGDLYLYTKDEGR